MHLGDVERRATSVRRIPGGLPEGRFAAALKLQDKLAPLHIDLFVETSPAPIKYAMSLIGKCANTVRLPMVPASEKAQAAVAAGDGHAGLINLVRVRPGRRDDAAGQGVDSAQGLRD